VGNLSAGYVVPLALLVVLTVVLCVAARRAPGRWIDVVAAIIALTLVISELSWQPYVVATHTWSLGASLPVQLCDVGAFVAARALAAGLRYRGAWAGDAMCLPGHVVWPARSPTFGIGSRT